MNIERIKVVNKQCTNLFLLQYKKINIDQAQNEEGGLPKLGGNCFN